MSPLLDKWLANIFFQSVVFFISLMDFQGAKVLNLIKSNLLSFSFMDHVLVQSVRTFLLMLGPKDSVWF